MEKDERKASLEEVKATVTDALMAEGVLPKVKAQIRAAVFELLLKSDAMNPNELVEKPAYQREEGEYNHGGGNLTIHPEFLAHGLVVDFLNSYGLKYTENILGSESSVVRVQRSQQRNLIHEPPDRFRQEREVGKLIGDRHHARITSCRTNFEEAAGIQEN